MFKNFLCLSKPTTVIFTYLALLFFVISDNSFSQLELENAFPNLSFNNPLYLTNSGDSTNRIFVVEQAGRIKVFPSLQSVSNASDFLDITDRVDDSGNEMGLLGLAFHPDYQNNGYFYVNYTTDNPSRSIISRFQATGNPDSADVNSEFEIITFSQPYPNHNGGWIGFGPNDGYLYIATGDGGGTGDPENNAQSINTLLGKILCIDVDGGSPYSIPPSNPFYDSTNTGIKKEIYAWGLRNPWRCSFDPVTGWFWAADVGQENWEEIDIIENGKNYGWRCYEGMHPYNTTGCNYPEYIYPIWEYELTSWGSITGGYVYRGMNVPELSGKYIYAHYGSMNSLWSLAYDGINPPANDYLLEGPEYITSFGLDEQMELYITSFDGNIYKFKPNPVPVELYSFKASVNGSHIILNWETKTEINNYGFEIQRSADNSWIKLGFVEGHGNSNSPKYYTYTDDHVNGGQKYFYRLKQLDNDGSFEYSNIIEINLETPVRFELGQNFPNPFNPTTTIQFSLPENVNNARLSIYNALGIKVAELVNTSLVAGRYSYQWNAQNAATGIYIYELRTENFVSIKKMILLK